MQGPLTLMHLRAIQQDRDRQFRKIELQRLAEEDGCKAAHPSRLRRYFDGALVRLQHAALFNNSPIRPS